MFSLFLKQFIEYEASYYKKFISVFKKEISARLFTHAHLYLQIARQVCSKMIIEIVELSPTTAAGYHTITW